MTLLRGSQLPTHLMSVPRSFAEHLFSTGVAGDQVYRIPAIPARVMGVDSALTPWDSYHWRQTCPATKRHHVLRSFGQTQGRTTKPRIFCPYQTLDILGKVKKPLKKAKASPRKKQNKKYKKNKTRKARTGQLPPWTGNRALGIVPQCFWPRARQLRPWSEQNSDQYSDHPRLCIYQTKEKLRPWSEFLRRENSDHALSLRCFWGRVDEGLSLVDRMKL